MSRDPKAIASPAQVTADTRSAIAFHAGVLVQIQRWHRVGLIDGGTRACLLRYERSQIAEASRAAFTPPEAPAADATLAPAPTGASPDPTPAMSATTADAPQEAEPRRPAPAVQAATAAPPVLAPAPAPGAAAKPASAPAAKPAGVRAAALPQRPESHAGSTLAVVGHFLRERTWWLVGAALTVVGSFFVAGTVWSDLGSMPRVTLVLVGLGVYAQAFAALGHRLARQEGGRRAGRWLVGVSVALAPVLAMAAGSGWSLGGLTGTLFSLLALLAVGGLLAWRLPRDLPLLLPSAAPTFRWIYLLLSVGVGMLPLAPSPAWLLLPVAIAALGLWWTLTRLRRLPPAVGLLLLHPLAFHAYLAPHGWSGAYAPALAVAALAVLYLDAALGRWRGVHAQHLRGLRGVLALTLAGLALLLLLPGFEPLPAGAETSIVGLLLAPFFLGAALCWRRPALIYGSLLAALLFTLALPDLFWAIVEPFQQVARNALGYSSEPLPLAWYSLTLLPYLLVCRLAAGGLRRSGWRQAEALSDHSWRWTFALSLLLVVLANTRGADLRPALLALPLHGALWLREHRVRSLVSGALPWAGLVVWTVDLLWFTGASAELRLVVGAGLVLALIPAGRFLARRLGEGAVLQGARIVAVPAAVLVPALLAGWQAPALALFLTGATLWLVSLSLRPLALPPSRTLYALESLLAVTGQALLAAGALAWAAPLKPSPLAWAAGLEAVAIAAVTLAWWLPRRRQRVDVTRVALEVWAHALALAAVIVLMSLVGLERSLMKLPVALLLAWWLSRTHWRVYGALLVFGVAESVLRRLWLADILDPGTLAVIAIALCWLPALALITMKRSVPRFGSHWIHRSLGQPAAWLGALAAGIALPWILLAGDPGVELQLTTLSLVAMLLAASRLVPDLRDHLEAAAWGAAIACATAWALGEPLVLMLPWLALLPATIGLLALGRPTTVRRAATVAAMCAAMVVIAVHGPLGQIPLLSSVAVALSLLALRRPAGWGEAAMVGWLVVVHALLERHLAPGLGWHLVTLSAAAALLWSLSQARDQLPSMSASARRAGQGVAIASAAAWAGWLGWIAIAGDLALWPAGLAAATALLWAYGYGATARLLAPWTISACLISAGAEPLLHPLAWLGFAAAAWLPSPRRASDRVGTRILASASAVGLAWVALTLPETRPAVAFAIAGAGLLAAHTGSQHRWAWGGLAAGLVCAAALSPVEPVAVLLRSSLAFTLVASLRHLPAQRGRVSPRALLWLGGSVALGLCTGAWALAALALLAGGMLLWRTTQGMDTRGPQLLEEPAGWILLAGSVALRAWDQGSGAESLLLAAAIPVLAWGLPRPWLFLASLPLLAWLPGEQLGLDFTVAWPASLAGLALLAWALRDRLPGGEFAVHLLLGLGSAAAAMALVDSGPVAYAAIAAPLALGWWLTERRSVALLQLLLGACLVSWDALGITSGVPALLLLLGVVGARRLESRWLELLATALLVPALLVGDVGLKTLGISGWQQVVLVGALALSLARTLGQDRPERWYATVAWGALLYLVLRVEGPLVHLPAKLELPLLVGLGVALECAALALERRRSEAWIQPLRHTVLGIAALALVGAWTLGGISSIGVALAGCLLCLRWVLRERSEELVLGVLLLNVATVMLFLRLQWTEPLAWIGPTGLSLLVVAQVLRQGLDPRIRDLLRYAGACCIYVTALGQAVFDPGWTLGLVVLSIAGLAMGSALRVRAFLMLGSGFLVAALITELLRFGLSNSQFWAFYLTTIGLTILAGMVALTLLRPQLATLRTRWQERLEDWE